MNAPTSLLGRAHSRLVFARRIQVLARHLAEEIPEGARVLDVGCGDGSLAALLMQRRPDIAIEGIDVFVRSETAIPVSPFDGVRIPRADNSVDAVVFVDVLHHTEDPAILLAEALRVARRAVIVKDHLCDGFLATTTLRAMDWVGNAHHGVVLPYNYWPEARWRETLARLGGHIAAWRSRLGLYPAPASLLFDRSLHFIARIEPPAAASATASPSESAAVSPGDSMP